MNSTESAVRVTIAMGTRPEAIKLLPVVKEMRKRGDGISCRVVSTGQQRDLLDQVFTAFDIPPEVDLRLMEPADPEASCSPRCGMSAGFARPPCACSSRAHRRPSS
jgi:UDP-N-acetylglucosamine 2-epimerase (non-hydrolysing)